MNEGTLVHKVVIDVSGESYNVMVFCRQNGRHFARTSLGDKDVIIHDGATLDDALSIHTNLLPLAIASRKIMREIKLYPLKAKRFRCQKH